VLLYTNTRLIGGMEEHMELIARHLDRRRFEVFSICPALESLAPFHESLIKYSDHFAPITFDYEHPFNFPALVRQIHNWRVDVMHMHNGYYRGQNLSLLAAMVAGVRKVYVTEHLAPEQPEMRHHALMRNLFVRFVSGTICVSEKNHQAREKLLFTPPERTFIVENGVDLDDFAPIPTATLADLRARYSLPADAEIVGTIVRFEPPKGLEYLIDAMVKIRQARPKAYLLMVGDGTIRAELEARCARELALGLVALGFRRDDHLVLVDACELGAEHVRRRPHVLPNPHEALVEEEHAALGRVERCVAHGPHVGHQQFFERPQLRLKIRQ